ncbi:AMP-dependent synthetase [Marinobacter vulgaris]|uniref:AMP-dependent synthetase n=1 Tax=Marinobacter vulgaris TaxID=1928331 RepID=A0A2V3ZQ26_9GAMM|nr:AMP-binding protein [Marinobacter vulgaris]PXX91826.1 AMP-dependent synthetase [Marinobacter vulgaris]TSJ70666.1 AMP-binding protein [Marinobacter vulgaris]
MAALPELLQRQSLAYPSRIALQGPDSAFSYRQMMQAAQALANQLRKQGIKRVGLCGDNSPAWILADLSCLLAEVVCVPVPGFFSKSQTSYLIERANLDCLLTLEQGVGSEHLGHGVWLRHLPVTGVGAWMPETTAKITFTSGSTGTPKGVCLSLAQMTATTLALKERLLGVELNRHLCVLPLATLLENIAGVYLPLLMGATVTVGPLQSLGMTGSSGLDLGRLVAGINQAEPQSLILVPELAMALVAAAEQGALESQSFRFLAVGGGRVSSELLARGRAAGLPLYEGYGLSECGSVVALNSPDGECEGTVGKSLSHVEVSVNAARHILVRGNTHLGYLGDEPEPERAREEVCKKWLDTGDLGALSPGGFLTVNGRAKNLIITSFGRNISPEWLESELIQALGAQQAVVFGDGDPNPSVLMVIRDGRSPEQLRSQLTALNAGLPDYARLGALYIRRQPLTQATGHLTTNGRPVRHRIQSDLPTLLAGAFPIFISALSTNQPGESHMAFFDRLQQETAEARAHVTGAPVIKAIAQGRFSLEAYTWFLTQAYHHVKHTVPLMMACGARLPERMEFVRKALVEYIGEEYGHHEWILDDLEACGADKEQVRSGMPDLSIELMVSYLYDQINRGNPVAFFGMVQVLEGTSIELATPMGEQIQKLLGLPEQAFSYLYSHGALDQEHFEFFRNLMNDITDPDDQQVIIDSARVVYRLYGDMLHNIPLPVNRKEQTHEAA